MRGFRNLVIHMMDYHSLGSHMMVSRKTGCRRMGSHMMEKDSLVMDIRKKVCCMGLGSYNPECSNNCWVLGNHNHRLAYRRFHLMESDSYIHLTGIHNLVLSTGCSRTVTSMSIPVAECCKKAKCMVCSKKVCCRLEMCKCFLVEACYKLEMYREYSSLVCYMLAVCNNLGSGIAKECNRSD